MKHQQDLTRLDNIQEQNLLGSVLEENQVSVEVSVKRNQTRLTHTDSQLTVCWVTMRGLHLIRHWQNETCLQTSVWRETIQQGLTHADSHL